MKNPKAKKCAGKRRSDGKPCQNSPMKGREYCIKHGGKVPKGPEHHAWKHGRFAKALPLGQLKDSFVDYMDDPDILNLADNIALLKARQEELILELSENNPTVGKELRESWRSVVDAVALGDESKVVESMKDHGRLVEASYSRERIWLRLRETTRDRRLVVGVEARRRARDMETLNAAQALHFQHQVVAIVASALRRHDVPTVAVDECVRLFDLMNEGIGIADENVPPLKLVTGHVET